jgi:hypothetical protein
VPACAADPVYINAPTGIEVGVGEDMGVGTAQLALPFDLAFLTGTDYQRDRNAYLTELNARIEPDITIDQLPLVRLDQVAMEVEWTIRNLDDVPGEARINLNGANQFFRYVPDNFIVESDDEDEPPPPPLAGNVPLELEPLGELNGVFREDQLREAAIDLDLVTRGGINPFQAMLAVHEDITSTADVPYMPYPPSDTPPPAPPPLPIEAFAHLVEIDLVFTANRHMVLEYTVRVRDDAGVLHDELLGAPMGELMVFQPADFVPAGITP